MTTLRAALLPALALALPLTAQFGITPPTTAPRTPTTALRVSFADAESRLGLAVTVSGAVTTPVAGHAYSVWYQFRVHTKKGEVGPVLALPENRAAFALGDVTPDPKSGACAFEFHFDLVRGAFAGMSNLTQGRMLVRLEPQVYDATAKSWITEAKSPALVLVLDVSNDQKVWSVRPFAGWFASQIWASDAEKAVAALDSLDAYDSEGNAIVPAFESVLTNPKTEPAQLVTFVNALPERELAFGKNNLRGVFAELGKHASADVKAAVERKQTEAHALESK